MDDNSRLWLARVAFWTVSTLDTSVLVKVAIDVGKGHTPFAWGGLFVVLTAVTMYAWVLTRKYKLASKQQSGKTLNQIEVEALATYGAQKHDKLPPNTPRPLN